MEQKISNKNGDLLTFFEIRAWFGTKKSLVQIQSPRPLFLPKFLRKNAVFQPRFFFALSTPEGKKPHFSEPQVLPEVLTRCCNGPQPSYPLNLVAASKYNLVIVAEP